MGTRRLGNSTVGPQMPRGIRLAVRTSHSPDEHIHWQQISHRMMQWQSMEMKRTALHFELESALHPPSIRAVIEST